MLNPNHLTGNRLGLYTGQITRHKLNNKITLYMWVCYTVDLSRSVCHFVRDVEKRDRTFDPTAPSICHSILELVKLSEIALSESLVKNEFLLTSRFYLD